MSSVFEKALKSIALTLAEEAEMYNVKPPSPPDTSDPKEIINYLKQVAAEISKVAGGSVADDCIEILEKFLGGNASEDDILVHCPIGDELPANPLDPFK